MKLRKKPGGVLAPKGFVGAGVECGLKADGGLDLAIVHSTCAAHSAAVFTTNKVCAGPVKVSRARAKKSRIRSVVVNSGVANALTGDRGTDDARRMGSLVAGLLDVPEVEVGVASTGVIGRFLDMDKIERGIERAAQGLGRSRKHAAAVARAIMTTDTVPKAAAYSVPIAQNALILGGVTKGAGMIAPRMAHATTISVLATDADVEPGFLQAALDTAVEGTINRVTVDGDTSTNDTVFLLANGAAGARRIVAGGPGSRQFQEALLALCDDLARRLAADGEGATKFIEIRVTGAASNADAHQAARAIANSPLFKTAMHGSDPNWGRIAAAAGYSGADLAEEKLRIAVNGAVVVKDAVPVDLPRAKQKSLVAGRDITVEVDLGRGGGSDHMYTCDLAQEYITINAHFTS